MFSARKPANIRKVTVPVKKKPAESGQPKSASATPSQTQPSSALRRAASNPSKPAPPSNGLQPGRRPHNASLSPSSVSLAHLKRARDDVEARCVGKRSKVSTPTQQFSSSSSEDESAGDDDFLKLAGRPARSPAIVVDEGRVIWSILEPEDKARQPETENGMNGEREAVSDNTRGIIHGHTLTAMEESTYRPAFGIAEGEAPYTVELQYPANGAPERFELLEPHEDGEYRPLDDIIQTVEQTLICYFPSSRSAPLLDDSSGIPRRVKRAIARSSYADFSSVIAEFNNLVRTAVADGTMRDHLRTVRTVPLSLVERILSQVYSRTVSPHVRSLTRYENGSDNVYGELLPRLVHDILTRDAGPLPSTSTFVDLGSGVGNVVLQAALETGCESWGIEQMSNPAALASAQAREFAARCALWGVRPGRVELLRGDFVDSTAVDGALQRADVVLVNNQAFQPQLNDKLVMRFLDLKDGARVVSLKTFVSTDKRRQMQQHNAGDPRNLLRSVVRREYGSGCVSWTDQGGEYFVATKRNLE